MSEIIAEMKARYGSRFARCPCGRTDVLLYKWQTEVGRDISGSSNGPDSDRFTGHDAPDGVACKYGYQLVADVPGAEVVP